jgi:coenzyme F420-reducing hydrogenase delta subunit
MVPPSLIDYVISRNLTDGVVIAGCAERGCYHRLGVAWTKQRIAGERDPYLRARVPRARLATIWASSTERNRFSRELASFTRALAALSPHTPPRNPASAATPAAKTSRPTEEIVS